MIIEHLADETHALAGALLGAARSISQGGVEAPLGALARVHRELGVLRRRAAEALLEAGLTRSDVSALTGLGAHAIRAIAPPRVALRREDVLAEEGRRRAAGEPHGPAAIARALGATRRAVSAHLERERAARREGR